MHSPLRPSQPWIPFPHKPRCSVAANAPRDWACVKLYHQRETAASLEAGIGLADPLNEAQQIEETSVLAGNARSALSANSKANICRVRRRTRSRNPPTRPPILRPPQRSKRSRARSGLQGRARVQVVKPGRRRPLSPRGSGPKLSQRWLRRLYRIVKPSRPIKRYKMPKKPHFVSLGPWPENNEWGTPKPITDSLEDINSRWVSNFPNLKISVFMKTWTSLDTDKVLHYYRKLVSDSSTADEDWLKLQDPHADRIWLNVMLWCLRHEKKKALQLLIVTTKGRSYRPPRYAVEDSLCFLSRHFLFEVAKPDSRAVDAFWLLTRKFIEGASEQERVFTVSQHLIFNVLRSIDNSRLLSFFWLLSVNKVVLHSHTMLQFMDRFIRMGEIHISMRLLGTVAKLNYDLSLPVVQMACVKLLRRRFDTPEEYTIRSNILAQMLDLGIRPKIQMFNVILANAGDGGDFANAWKMYALAKDNGLVPDPITYSVLLKGAILSGYLPNIYLVLREIQAKPEVLQNVYILNHMLKAISLTVSPGHQFDAMLDLYKLHCDLRPLHDLSLIASKTSVLPNADYHGLQPTNSILRQMILAYIRRRLRQREGPLHLIHNYNLYYQHIKGNHPVIAPLAQEDNVANAFIMAFGKRPETLQHCITVIRHMLEFSSQRRAASDTVAYSAPNVHTWSVLVAAYLFNHQSRAAEKVLDMMRERGIEYTQVTWNTLVSGYAGMQNVDKAVKAVKGMEAAGFEANAYTAKGLGRLWFRDKVMEALKPDLEEAPSNETTNEGLLPPLSPEEQDEARRTLEWESKSLERRNQVSKYVEAKYKENWGMKSDDSSEGLFAVA